MVRKHEEVMPEGLEIRYVSVADLKQGMPFQQKFAFTPERRTALRRLMEHKGLQHIVVALQGHPIAYLAVEQVRFHAYITVFEETMPGTIDNPMFGRIADFLAVEWLINSVSSSEGAFDAWGERDGQRCYSATTECPDFRRGIPLDANGVHTPTGLKFVYLTRPIRDELDIEQRRELMPLILQGIRDEAGHDELVVHLRTMLAQSGGELENVVKKTFRDARFCTALIYDSEGMKIVGQMFLRNNDPFNGKEYLVNGMVIAKEYRGLGYGRMLLDFAMANLDSRCRILKAEVFSSNIVSRSLFEKHPAFSFVSRERAQSRLVNGYYRRTGSTGIQHYFSEQVPV
jgi:ribosomal protein S18 acetylase RimI-like enzyme